MSPPVAPCPTQNGDARPLHSPSLRSVHSGEHESSQPNLPLSNLSFVVRPRFGLIKDSSFTGPNIIAPLPRDAYLDSKMICFGNNQTEPVTSNRLAKVAMVMM